MWIFSETSQLQHEKQKLWNMLNTLEVYIWFEHLLSSTDSTLKASILQILFSGFPKANFRATLLRFPAFCCVPWRLWNCLIFNSCPESETSLRALEPNSSELDLRPHLHVICVIRLHEWGGVRSDVVTTQVELHSSQLFYCHSNGSAAVWSTLKFEWLVAA